MADSSTDKITPLPALRAPTTGLPANVGNTDTPLPTLHTAALGGSTMSEKDAPSLTELRIARAPTPLEDENTVITAHSRKFSKSPRSSGTDVPSLRRYRRRYERS